MLYNNTPQRWWEQYNNFILSTAVWSVLGYLTGLGDRHGGNILINIDSYIVHHIDYGVLFNDGM